MLDTRSEETICKSLGNILGIRKEALEVFWARTMPDYVCKHYWEIDTGIFYDYFNLTKDEFVLNEVVFYHVTTRLTEQRLGEFKIDNLEEVLLSDNPMTQLCKSMIFCLNARMELQYIIREVEKSLINQWKQDFETGWIE